MSYHNKLSKKIVAAKDISRSLNLDRFFDKKIVLPSASVTVATSTSVQVEIKK